MSIETQELKEIQTAESLPLTSGGEEESGSELLSEAFSIYKHRNVLSMLVARDMESRHRGSLLGKLWPLVHPLGQLLIYTFVFSVVLKVKFGEQSGTGSFAINFMAGLIPWSIFSESVSRACIVILEHPNLVTKVVFPTEVLPLMNVFSALATQFLAFTVLLGASTLYLHTVHPTILLLPIIALPLVCFSAGVSWFISSIGVFVRDTRHFVSLGLQAGMYATPILYPADAVPEQFKWVLSLNPIAGMVDDFRRILIQGLLPDWSSYLAYSSVSLIVALLGLLFFLKTKRSFADVM